MNPYIKNLNRLEFVVTLACTGRCRHCSEGSHTNCGEHIEGDAAAEVIRKIGGKYKIDSVMSFGGEPLLYPEAVSKIHKTAKDIGIPKRQLITNGFFAKDIDRIKNVAEQICKSGVNSILLSVDAFHQENIPLESVKRFAEAIQAEGVKLRTNPAWLVSKEDENPYNIKTKQILQEFEELDIPCASGNVIFPEGNALKYLEEYFVNVQPPDNPYAQNPMDIKTISINPNGDTTIGGNIYQTDILESIAYYEPEMKA